MGKKKKNFLNIDEPTWKMAPLYSCWEGKFVQPSQGQYGTVLPNSKYMFSDFLGGPEVKNPPTNAGDTGSIPASAPGRFYMLGVN